MPAGVAVFLLYNRHVLHSDVQLFILLQRQLDSYCEAAELHNCLVVRGTPVSSLTAK